MLKYISLAKENSTKTDTTETIVISSFNENEGYSSVVGHLLSIGKALSSVLAKHTYKCISKLAQASNQ